MKPLERRVAALEEADRPQLPWHLPADQWSDEQLLALAAPGRKSITDAELAEIAKGDS